MSKVVALMSGGLDSTVAIAEMIAAGHKIQGLSFNYGQKHGIPELEAGQRIAHYLGIPRHVINNSEFGALAESGLTSDKITIPSGKYSDESLEATVVPGRNAHMIIQAGIYAQKIGFEAVLIGSHSGDHPVYADCRPEFFEAMRKVFAVIFPDIEIWTPFVDLDKSEIVARGQQFNAPMAITYSCYEGIPGIHCGVCSTCQERKEAFDKAGVHDYTDYQDIQR